MSTETIVVGLVLALGAFVAIRERVKVQSWRVSEQLPPANIAGVFAGRPDYNRCHPQAQVIDGVSLCEARRTGRMLGDDVTVEWVPGQDWEIDNHAKWLLEHGKQNGVFVRSVAHYSEVR